MSGAVSMMLGVSSGPRVDISAGFTADDTIGGPGTAAARVEFQSDGDVVSVNSVGPTDAGDWIAPKGAAPGAYEIMFHQNSGDALTGSDALDTWLALSSTRLVGLETSTPGSKSANITASIRLNGGAVLSSGTVGLSVTVI